ncbi:hypothetical protein [Nocardia abscessus]|nr:hypothetical protein [Nocardia abscessus]
MHDHACAVAGNRQRLTAAPRTRQAGGRETVGSCDSAVLTEATVQG